MSIPTDLLSRLDLPIQPSTMEMCRKICSRVVEKYSSRELGCPFIPVVPLLCHLLHNHGVDFICIAGWISFNGSRLSPPFGRSIGDDKLYFPSVWLKGHDMILDPALDIFRRRYPSGSNYERVLMVEDGVRQRMLDEIMSAEAGMSVIRAYGGNPDEFIWRALGGDGSMGSDFIEIYGELH